MWSAKNGIEKLLGMIILLLLPLLISPAPLFGGEVNKKPREEPKSKSDFVLTVKDNLISLDANDASLVEIVGETGSRIKIDVITKISEEKKITIKFDKLPLEAVIERLREFADIAYIRKTKANIAKILLFPKGKGEELSKPMVNEEKEENSSLISRNLRRSNSNNEV